ncbi:hypothetical protein Tco_0276101 [Tanacetum coccineum]
MYSARLCNSMISSLSITPNFHNSLTSCSAYTARSCDRVILPLAILSESQVTTSCCSNNPTLARRVTVSCMADTKLIRIVSMSSLTDSRCSSGGGINAGDGNGSGGSGSGDGDTTGRSGGGGDIDLLRDEDGKSDCWELL